MYEQIINSLGLSKVQAEIFNSLLIDGPDKASNIAKKIKRPRGVAYKGLEELIDLNLAIKKEAKAGIALFSVEHPANLEQILEKKEKDLAKTKSALAASLPDLVSAYNLISNKPGVKFYEGEEGLRKVLDDTLRSKTDIYLFINKEALASEEIFKEVNEEYKKKREKLEIKKKIIRAGVEPYHEKDEGKEYEKITEIRYLGNKTIPFKASIQVYDNKISFQVPEDNNIISIAVEDKNIYEMSRVMFEFIWKSLEKTK